MTSIVMPGYNPATAYQDVEGYHDDDNHPLLKEGAINNAGSEKMYDQNRLDDLEAAAVAAMAVSPDLWVTPELRERNPEAFASYSPNKERKSMRQAALRIQENKMQTLKSALASCKKLSANSLSASTPLPTNISIERPEEVVVEAAPASSGASFAVCSGDLNACTNCQTTPSLLSDPKGAVTRISEDLDERMVTGKQALIAIMAAVLMPLVVIGVVHVVGFYGMALAILSCWAIYGIKKFYQEVIAQPEPQEVPLHLREYGLMDHTKLQSMVDAQVQRAFLDDSR